MLLDGTPFRLLVRHFVRRFVDNDLISAHADRHESLAFFGATLIAAGMFGGALIGSKYLFGVPSASWVAVSALYDMSTIVTVCMIAVALTTVTQWDALSLDNRDAAVLGPLPVSYRTIICAKATANVVFGCALVGGAAIPCSVIFSFFELASLRLEVGAQTRVLAAHILASSLAASYAFIAVVALRETLRLLTGSRGFARISPVIQALLVVTLTTLLLLILGGNDSVTRTWGHGDGAAAGLASLAMPALFVGLAQALIGDAIVSAPIGGIVVTDDLSRWYLARRDVFVNLGMTSFAVTAGALLLAATAFLWNCRRLPPAAAQARPHRNRVRHVVSKCAASTIARSPVVQATFAFTLRVLFRSGPHRLTMAVGAAVALALAIAVVTSAGLARDAPATEEPLSRWALQPLVLIALAAMLRHAMALPAELRANWVFHQCWPGRPAECVAGAARAAFVAVLGPAVVILVPIHAMALGAGAALFHAMNGVILSAILISLAMIDRNAPPFLTSYERTGNVNTIGPVLVLIALAFSFAAAAVERSAFATTTGIVRHTLGMLAVLLAVRLIAKRPAASGAALTTEAPEPSADPLRLSG